MKQQNKQHEIDFFNTFQDRDYDVFDEEGYERLLREFKKVVQNPNEQCIDFGCGTGAFTKRLSKFGLKLTGIDISPGIIKYAQDNIKGVKFIVGDIEHTGLKGKSYDIVVFSGVLHHFEDYTRTLKEAYRLLKTGGRVWSYDPNKHNPAMWLYRDQNSPFSSQKGRTDNERLLTRNELKKNLRVCGFRSVDVRGISGVTFKYVASDVGKKVLPIYNWIDRKMIFPSYIGSFVVASAIK